MNKIMILNNLQDLVNWTAAGLNNHARCIKMLGVATIATGILFYNQDKINKHLAKEIDRLKEEMKELKGE